jgi:hypothetical protein
MKKYCSTISQDEYHLKPGYSYEMACHANVQRFRALHQDLLWGLGSGKTFNLAKLIRRYRQVFQKQRDLRSVNDVKNEPAFKDLVEPVLEANGKPVLDSATGKPVTKSIIKELDFTKVETVLDVFNPIFSDSLAFRRS